MDHFAGLDVSVKESSICIVDDTGRTVREVKVASEPEALLKVLGNPAYRFKRIGLEAGPLSQWLFSALAEAELPVVCVETRHMQAVLKAQINKTDRNDARGIAQMIRAGLYRPVHVKTLRSQKLRMLLTHRKLLQSKAIAIENDLRGTLRNFGLKVGMVGKVRFEARIQELVEDFPDLAELVEPLLIVRRALREQIVILHRRLLAIVRDDEVCRRLMTTPGVGPVVALTYRATVDVPARFRKSKSVGAVFGLTCSRYQSGEVDWSGKISRCGDEMMRTMLYEAAQSMMHSKKWSWLKAWAMQIARRRGMKKAIVALARRLAVIMHRIWVDCVSAWNKDPIFGVIGIQSGPRDKGPQWLPPSHGSRGWDAGGGDDCEDPSRLFCSWSADQGDLPRASGIAQSGPQGHPFRGDGVPVRARDAAAPKDGPLERRA
jgi:transposase